MTKSSKNLWARFLFRDRGILPGRKLLVIYSRLSVCLLILSFAGLSWVYLIAMNVLFILSSFFDLLFSPKRGELKLERYIIDEMERGLTYEVTLEVHNVSQYPCKFKIIDDLPPVFQKDFPVKGTVKATSKSEVKYETIATARGKYHLNQLYVRYTSKLGLWEKQMVVELINTVKVIPDLTDTRHYLENAQAFLLHEGEKIRRQQRGTGEFAQIRKYVVGDDPRKINWRQTAKLQEVMTNEYEPEHGKYLTILIDCGRMMGAELTKGNRLDKTVEAAITVAATALKNGDYVGVLAFSNDIKIFVPPEKGMDQLQKIIQSIYHLQADPIESNYSAVMSYLQVVQKKRSLILLFSDVYTFLLEDSSLYYMKQLRQKHLFLMIGIEDASLQEEIGQYPYSVRKAMLKSIAQQHVQIKKRQKAKWETQGLTMVEAKEEKLTTEAVSQAIRWMNQGLL